MDKGIKLSIVIPTLNSEDVLEETLMALMPQTLTESSIEVLIINNGSTDRTQFIIDKYREEYPLLRYITRKETIPANENFEDGVHQALGEYVFLLGDDDILSPSFIKDISPLLNNNYGLVHFNRIVGLNNLSENIKSFRNVDSKGILEYHQFNSFLEEYSYEFNFMSSIIFKKEVWLRGEHFVSFDKPYYGYHWYATLLFGAVDSKCVYLSFPLVIQRVRNKTWQKEWPLYWIVGMFSIYRDLDSIIPGIYSVFYKKQHDENKDYFISLFAGIANAKSLYKNHQNEMNIVLNKRERRLLYITLNTPPYIGRLLQKIFRLVRL